MEKNKDCSKLKKVVFFVGKIECILLIFEGFIILHFSIHSFTFSGLTLAKRHSVSNVTEMWENYNLNQISLPLTRIVDVFTVSGRRYERLISRLTDPCSSLRDSCLQ